MANVIPTSRPDTLLIVAIYPGPLLLRLLAALNGFCIDSFKRSKIFDFSIISNHAIKTNPFSFENMMDHEERRCCYPKFVLLAPF